MKRFHQARSRRTVGFLAALLMPAISGCSLGDGHPGDASPIVSVDSEQGKRAIAEADEFCQLRQAQEAKAHARTKRRRGRSKADSTNANAITSQYSQYHQRKQP